MTQEDRLNALLSLLLAERKEYKTIPIPQHPADKRRLYRSLINVRPPIPVGGAFLEKQDAYLQEEIRSKGITRLETLTPVRDEIYLWQGDITTLAADAIVNAANSQLLGCFVPCHGCIDNAIHTFAGVQLRAACAEIMRRQGHKEKTGTAKITPGFNLPCRYILHTVGPVVGRELTPLHENQLADCYQSCLELAAKQDIQSVAFCCISTGEFHFPNRRAAEIAIGTVQRFQADTTSKMKVIFNVYKEIDFNIYQGLLAASR